MKRQRIRKFDASEVQGDGAWVEVAMWTFGQRRAELASDGSSIDRILGRLTANVRAWNWIDDDDEPLPQPKDNPDAFDPLDDDEVGFLNECVLGLKSDEELKN